MTVKPSDNMNIHLLYSDSIAYTDKFNSNLPENDHLIRLLNLQLLKLDIPQIAELIHQKQMKESLGITQGQTDQTRGLFKLNISTGEERFELLFCIPGYCKKLQQIKKYKVKHRICKKITKTIYLIDIGLYQKILFSDYSDVSK
ncbi:MAG: hypothetical protein OEZ01_02385 [Candidatus Heimdallarchaeota archaeon]|nr:hypothetical protein [Candidatus Heimdallarchaeota archaeon]